ncbi:hypothetical protein DF186_23410, partial [Enterococcus hirae]
MQDPFVHANEENVPFVVEASSGKSNANAARKDIYKKAVEQATREQILQMISLEQYNSKKREIHRKIFSQSGKYIP